MTEDDVITHLSFSDLRRVGYDFDVKEFPRKFGTNVKINKVTCKGERVSLQRMRELLYECGLDVEKSRHRVEQKTKHRNLAGFIVDDYRFVCHERSDEEWLESGHASDEIQIATSKMSDMADEIRILQGGGGEQ